MLEVPDQIGKEDQERDGAAGKKPGRKQELAVLRKKKSGEESESEDRDGVFDFEAESGDRAKGKPEFRILRVDHANDRVSAARPEQRLKGVHGELMIDDPPDRGSGSQRSC